MKIRIFVILVLIYISFANVNACIVDCDINVDSLFQKNISMLKENTVDAAEYVIISNSDNLKFLYVVSFLSGINTFENFYAPKTKLTTIVLIEEWYNNKKEKITCEKVKKAYLLLEPQNLKNIEEIEKYTEELDKLRIE